MNAMGVDYWGPRIALVLCGAFLIVLIVFLFYAWLKGYSTKFWYCVEGKITGSKDTIEYTYEISGCSYTGKNWYRSGPKLFQSKRNAVQFIREYAESKIVSVYFNPKKEFESCLRTMEDAKNFLVTFVAFLILSFCIAKWISL